MTHTTDMDGVSHGILAHQAKLHCDRQQYAAIEYPSETKVKGQY